MIQIIRITFNDDKDASMSIDVMVCSAIDAAKEIILGEINKGFDGNWKTLSDAASELCEEIYHCEYDEKNMSFSWEDNCKGETYKICRINMREVNTKFQGCL